MIWMFALGIIGFCIVSVGFRKLVFGLLAAGALLILGTVSYFVYQGHVEKQQVAAEQAQAKIDEAKYPPCVGKDQFQAFLEAGGECRESVGDPDMDKVLVEGRAAQLRSDKIKYAACDVKPFEPYKYSECRVRVDKDSTSQPASGVGTH